MMIDGEVVREDDEDNNNNGVVWVQVHCGPWVGGGNCVVVSVRLYSAVVSWNPSS